MAADIRKSEWLRCDLYPNKVWSIVRKRAQHHILMELYGRGDPQTNENLHIEPNYCLWTGRVMHVVPGLVRPNHQGECSFTVHTEDNIVVFHARSEKSMIEWVNLIKRMLPKNDNEYTTNRNAAAVRPINNSQTNRSPEAALVSSPTPSSSNIPPTINGDYGHLSAAISRPIFADQRTPFSQNISSTVCPEPSSESTSPDIRAAQRLRPKPQPKAPNAASSTVRSPTPGSSTRDPTSPLPPTPDTSNSLYGAVYPTPVARALPATIEDLTPTIAAVPPNRVQGLPDDPGLYGHLSQCSSSQARRHLDKAANSIFGRLWPLSWWKDSNK